MKTFIAIVMRIQYRQRQWKDEEDDFVEKKFCSHFHPLHLDAPWFGRFVEHFLEKKLSISSFHFLVYHFKNYLHCRRNLQKKNKKNTHLHCRRNAFSVAEDFVQVFRPQNVPQGCLGQKPAKRLWRLTCPIWENLIKIGEIEINLVRLWWRLVYFAWWNGGHFPHWRH